MVLKLNSVPYIVEPDVVNVDPGDFVERDIKVPWFVLPEVSWIDYRCWIETTLDAGMALHKPLPQSTSQPPPSNILAGRLVNIQASHIDTLGSVVASDAQGLPDATMETSKDGVNTESVTKYTDVSQKMATSDYRFRLRGFGVRVGYQVPIPRLVSVAGVAAIPGERQFAFNEITGNYSGIPLWYAEWDLHYFVTSPPTKAQLPPPNMAQHIRADQQLARDLAAPYSHPDSNSVITELPTFPGIIVPQ